MTHVSAGANFNFKWSNWAAHPGTFHLYITKDGFDPNKPLAWSDLESSPFLSVTNPPQSGAVGSETGHYFWSGKLPNKSGRHIIYGVWTRSDSTETFYNCSDVVFDGGNGEVTGIRGTSSTPTTSPTPTSTDAQAPTAPTNLRVTGTTASSVSLSWSASSDDVGVTGYRVYRGTELIGTVSGTSFTDTGLSPSTNYSYWLRAVDAAGNVSAASATIEATTNTAPSPTPTPTPTATTGTGLRGAAPSGFRIGTAVANGPLANEAIYRDTLAREFNSATARTR